MYEFDSINKYNKYKQANRNFWHELDTIKQKKEEEGGLEEEQLLHDDYDGN